MKDDNYEDERGADGKIILKMEADDFEVHETNPLEFIDEGDSTLSWDKYKPSSSKDASKNSSTPVDTTRQALKRRSGRTTSDEYNKMLDFFKKNKGLAQGKFTAIHGRPEAGKKWEELAVLLNSVRGTEKTAAQWHITWRDLKSRTSIKARERRKQLASTGTNPVTTIELSDLEMRVLDIIGSHYKEDENDLQISTESDNRDVLLECDAYTMIPTTVVTNTKEIFTIQEKAEEPLSPPAKKVRTKTAKEQVSSSQYSIPKEDTRFQSVTEQFSRIAKQQANAMQVGSISCTSVNRDESKTNLSPYTPQGVEGKERRKKLQAEAAQQQAEASLLQAQAFDRVATAFEQLANTIRIFVESTGVKKEHYRKRRAEVLKYYEVIGDICKCNTCGANMKGDRIYNLKAHLERHKINLMSLFCHPHKKIKPPEVKKNIKIEIARNSFLKACLGLITDDALPLKVFNSSNFKTILDPICDGLSGPHGKSIRLNTEYVCNTISSVAINIRKNIKSELRGKLLSFKVECATVLSRTFLTISTQIVLDDKIESFVLGLIEMNKEEEWQTHALTDSITNILKKFGVAHDQIFSITSDNGADMIKASVPERKAEKTNKAYQQNMQAYNIFDEFFIVLGVIRHYRFVAHTAQLCVLDVTNDSDVKHNLMQCRNLTKFIHNVLNGLRGKFEAKQVKLPELDCVFRWGSTYSMICDLHNARDILSNVKSTVNKSDDENFNLNKNLWNFIEAYVKVFAPLQKILIKFQEELLSFGDFYANWLKCKLMTQRFLTSDEKECEPKSKYVKILANSLLLSLEAREQKFLLNDQIIACLYLDPRFHHLLNQERKLKASDFLLKLWEKLRRINPKMSENEQKTSVSTDMKTVQNFSSDEDDENQILNNFLFHGICSRKIELNQDLKTKIQLFNPSFSGSNTNIFEFWKSKKQFDPELYALAQVCFSIPATQSSAEWTSSSNELIKSYLHNELTYSQLEDIFVVKLNKLFLDEGFEALNLLEDPKKQQ